MITNIVSSGVLVDPMKERHGLSHVWAVVSLGRPSILRRICPLSLDQQLQHRQVETIFRYNLGKIIQPVIIASDDKFPVYIRRRGDTDGVAWSALLIVLLFFSSYSNIMPEHRRAGRIEKHRHLGILEFNPLLYM